MYCAVEDFCHDIRDRFSPARTQPTGGRLPSPMAVWDTAMNYGVAIQSGFPITEERYDRTTSSLLYSVDTIGYN